MQSFKISFRLHKLARQITVTLMFVSNAGISNAVFTVIILKQQLMCR